VRVYATEVEILDERGTLLRRHQKAERKGQFVMQEQDRLFNPSRETARILGKIAKIGPSAKTFSLQLFARGGRAEHKHLYALSNLTRHHSCIDRRGVPAGVDASSTALSRHQTHLSAHGGCERQQRCTEERAHTNRC